MKRENIFETMENDIMNANIGENDKNKMLKNIMRLKEKKVNILITGATGCGKSSTINAMFDTEVAKVGVSVDPETMEIEKYELDNLVLWDTPGLGDGKEADNRHAKKIISKLTELDENGNALIDLVLVIIDGGNKDLGTSYELINKVIIPNLGDDKEGRILVAINQADVAMKGYNWDREKNEPNNVLKEFLEKKVISVKNRVYEATGVKIEPIYYCAGYKEEGVKQYRPYNLSKLLYYIVKSTPVEKRVIYINNINEDEEMWKDDDKLIEYGEETRKNLLEAVVKGVSKGVEIGGRMGEKIGGSVGKVFGEVGEHVGKTVGRVVVGAAGAVVGGVVSVIGRLFR